MCQSDYGTFQSNVKNVLNTGIKLDVVLPTEVPIPVGGEQDFFKEFTETKFDEWKKHSCEDINKSMTEQQFLEKIKSSPDPEAMKEFTNCLKLFVDQPASLIRVWEKINDKDNVTVYIRYTAVGDPSTATVEDTIKLPDGVVVQGEEDNERQKIFLAKGYEIRPGTKIITLDRSRRKEGFALSLNTNRGSGSVFIPKRENEPEPSLARFSINNPKPNTTISDPTFVTVNFGKITVPSGRKIVDVVVTLLDRGNGNRIVRRYSYAERNALPADPLAENWIHRFELHYWRSPEDKCYNPDYPDTAKYIPLHYPNFGENIGKGCGIFYVERAEFEVEVFLEGVDDPIRLGSGVFTIDRRFSR